jgi:4,5:9,10-diseco-3-hydroxy-5,9,17-trioxoandrosta-1(10),2-diene-4-oate hydrolase
LVLLHALGESAQDWRWVLPELARTHRVYAPDLPGFGDSTKPVADYSPSFFARFVTAFLDVLKVERTVIAGNSLGGLIALHLALSEPSRVEVLGLIDSAGLGQEVNYALRQPTLPGQGELAVILGKTPLGATVRTWLRVPLLFARPNRVPTEWFEEQQRLTQLPGFLEAVVAALRAQVNFEGQREVLLEQLPQLQMPTLVIWGASDRIFPKSQAQEAIARLKQGSLEIIADCGHLPHIERPGDFVAALGVFLKEQTSSR